MATETDLEAPEEVDEAPVNGIFIYCVTATIRVPKKKRGKHKTFALTYHGFAEAFDAEEAASIARSAVIEHIIEKHPWFDMFEFETIHASEAPNDMLRMLAEKARSKDQMAQMFDAIY